jgi:hypothetical protein
MVGVPTTLAFNTVHHYANSPSGIEVVVGVSVAQNRSVELVAKVDTGADCCVFQREYADELELHMEDGEKKKFATQTGALETRGHLVTLSSLGYDFESLVYFAVEEGLPRNVLGLQGWLEKFRLAIVHYDR